MTDTRHEAYERDIDRARLLRYAGPRQIMISTPRAVQRTQRGFRNLVRRRQARLQVQRQRQ